MSRFLPGAVLAIASCLSPAADVVPLDVVEISPGNFVHYGAIADRTPGNRGDNANIGFIVGDRCVLAVDTGGSRAVGDALRAAIRGVTPLPVCHVVFTHVHPDHFFGAAAFAGDHPEFIAHENYPAQLAARSRNYVNSLQRDLGPLAAGSDIVEPAKLVKGSLQLDLGGRRVTVRAWPTAHTDDDLTVLDESTGTLWLGDLLFVTHTPIIDGSLEGFLAVMQDLRTLPAAHYVPGHGRSELPWPAPLDAQQRYLTVIRNETRAALHAKKTIQQATDEVGLSEEKNWALFDLFHRRNVTQAYTELEWE